MAGVDFGGEVPEVPDHLVGGEEGPNDPQRDSEEEEDDENPPHSSP
jgi:hypothetical protein